VWVPLLFGKSLVVPKGGRIKAPITVGSMPILPKNAHARCNKIQRYMAKIPKPLLDRIDLHIEVPAVKYKEFSTKESGESSEIRARVMQAREIQVHRFKGRK